MISANWEVFLISSQGSILTFVIARKQIVLIREIGWGHSPLSPEGQIALAQAQPWGKAAVGWKGPGDPLLALGA